MKKLVCLVIVLALSAAASADLIASSDMESVVGGYILNSGTGGSALDGYLIGGATIVNDAEKGNVLSLDGIDGFVDCGNDTAWDITEKITVSLDYKSTGADGDWDPFIAKGDGTADAIPAWSDGAWRVQMAPGSRLSEGLTGTSRGWLDGTSNIKDGAWHHLEMVYNGTSESLYVDGVLEAQAASTGSINVNSYPVWIGSNYCNVTRFITGLIDNVQVSNVPEPATICLLGLGGLLLRRRK